MISIKFHQSRYKIKPKILSILTFIIHHKGQTSYLGADPSSVGVDAEEARQSLGALSERVAHLSIAAEVGIGRQDLRRNTVCFLSILIVLSNCFKDVNSHNICSIRKHLITQMEHGESILSIIPERAGYAAPQPPRR